MNITKDMIVTDDIDALTIAIFNECFIRQVFDIETSIGLLWCRSVRDDFRHMWE